MKLSILIPTHNRPVYFQRCLNSVIKQLPKDVEVIINNDSDDIQEIQHPSVQYFYEKFNNLSDIYEFLLNKATGEYIYYLEDDDYLNDTFFSKLVLDADLIVGNYMPTYDVKDPLEYARLYTNADVSEVDLLTILNFEHLQLSQHVFKRSTIENFEFPGDNNVHNDIKLVLHAANRAKTIKTTSQIFYYQTTDAGDNLSFPNSSTKVIVTFLKDFLPDGLFKTTPPSTRS